MSWKKRRVQKNQKYSAILKKLEKSSAVSFPILNLFRHACPVKLVEYHEYCSLAEIGFRITSRRND